MIKKNDRIMISISVELNERLTQLCEDYGMTKSSLCAYYIGKQVNLETKVNSLASQESVNSIMLAMANDLKKF